MPKTDINTILKNGAKAKLAKVDYTSPEMKDKLKALKERNDKMYKTSGKWHPPIVITV